MHFAYISCAKIFPATVRSLFTKSLLSVAALGLLGQLSLIHI